MWRKFNRVRPSLDWRGNSQRAARWLADSLIVNDLGSCRIELQDLDLQIPSTPVVAILSRRINCVETK